MAVDASKEASGFDGDFVVTRENKVSQPDLRAAFERFRKDRKNEMRNLEDLERRAASRRADPERMEALRRKFLERAYSYVGVPYAKKYHQKRDDGTCSCEREGCTDYDAPLYLDCCGIIRQVLRDLKEDFGFTTGRWNQAYQFDTLPIALNSVDELKPGDLIFYSAKYFNPKARAQIHDMVHVEIYIGNGRTLGARWQKGQVQEHDSYIFTPRSYGNVVHHFRSIDTWLMGICKSHCSAHAWQKPSINHGRFSIFNAQNAGGSGESSTAAATSTQQGAAEDEVADENDLDDPFLQFGGGDGDDDNGEIGVAPAAAAPAIVPAPGTSSAPMQPKGGSTGVKERVDASTRPLRPSNAATAKKTPVVRSVSKPPEPLTRALPLLRRSAEAQRTSAAAAAVPKRATGRPDVGKVFFVGGNNGSNMITGILEGMGWRKTTDKGADKYRLKWTELKSEIDYTRFVPGKQLANHIPNASCLTTKNGLYESLKEYERTSKTTLDFVPETYRMDVTAERTQFFSVAAGEPQTVWICKPTSMNQGKGIYLVKDPARFRKELEDEERSGKRITRIVQRYIPNPLLIHGKKFDVRVYMLVASTSPFVAFYHTGYLRLSIEKYGGASIDNLTAHLTNQYVQKKHPQFGDLKDDTVWDFDQFQRYLDGLSTQERPIPGDWVRRTFEPRIMDIMQTCIASVRHKLDARAGLFDLYGFDFMVDEGLHTWLIECNVNPALHTTSRVLQHIIPAVVEETLAVVIEIDDKRRAGQPLFPLSSVKNLVLLQDGNRRVPIAP